MSERWHRIARIAIFLATVTWLSVLPVAIVLDPTSGHDGDTVPPLWGWWIFATIAMPVLMLIGVGLWAFGTWAFDGLFD